MVAIDDHSSYSKTNIFIRLIIYKITLSGEGEANDAEVSALYISHGEKLKAVAKKGKIAGKEVFHYKCKYCSKYFIGPGSGTFLEHICKVHPKKCPKLVSMEIKPPIRDLFSTAKMNLENFSPRFIYKSDTSFVSSSPLRIISVSIAF